MTSSSDEQEHHHATNPDNTNNNNESSQKLPLLVEGRDAATTLNQEEPLLSSSSSSLANNNQTKQQHHVNTTTSATISATIEDFQCSICLELLYKPCVNTCGHTFCFWCFHKAMDMFSTIHTCPLCRSEFRHFPAVCIPLYKYIAWKFPVEHELRRSQIEKLEKEEYHAESPKSMIEETINTMMRKNELEDEGKEEETKRRSPTTTSSTRRKGDISDFEYYWKDDFKCVNCGNLPCPPVVFPCGHIVCSAATASATGAAGSVSICCPVNGCTGNKVCSTSSAVHYYSACNTCYLIDDKILHANMSQEEYDAAARKKDSIVVSSKCCWTNNTNEDNKGDHNNHNNNNPSSSSSTTPQVKPSDNQQHKNINNNHYNNFVHYGVGCDGCGVCPIVGRRYKCNDCSEEVGFDLCQDCYYSYYDDDHNDTNNDKIGISSSPSRSSSSRSNLGRFNQQHTSDHTMVEVEQKETILHVLQRSNPTMTLPQLMSMLGIT